MYVLFSIDLNKRLIIISYLIHIGQPWLDGVPPKKLKLAKRIDGPTLPLSVRMFQNVKSGALKL